MDTRDNTMTVGTGPGSGSRRGATAGAKRRRGICRGTAAGAARRCTRDRGLSTVEVVILAPVMLLFILVLVAFGQLVDGRGAVDGAARDAARAGSLQHDYGVAMSEARKAADADLDNDCVGPPKVSMAGTRFQPRDGVFTVEVRCEVRGLAMLGLNVGKSVTGRASSPIDPLKRSE